MQRIILASQSPRRKQLLEWAEVSFDVIIQPTDESFPEGTPAVDAPLLIAREKAKSVHNLIATDKALSQHKGKSILAADTVVILDNTIIGKPKSRTEAIETLTKLSGKKHQVVTGVSILTENGEIGFSDVTTVSFHELTTEQISFYVDKYQPYDKAGAYAIQEWIGVVGIASIEGDFYNVMGLPVSKVVQALM